MRFRPGAFVLRCLLMLAAGLIAFDLVVLAIHFPGCLWLAAAAFAYRRWKRRGEPGDAYGSARSSDIGELWRKGMLGDRGLVLGTCGYLGRPSRWQGVRALFSRLPSPIACRLFFAAFFGGGWLER